MISHKRIVLVQIVYKDDERAIVILWLDPGQAMISDLLLLIIWQGMSKWILYVY